MKNTKIASTLIIGIIVGIVLGYVLWSSESKKIEEPETKTDTKTETTDPHSMHTTMTNMTGKLEGKKGDELDKAFLEEMITHHEGAVEMAQIVLDNSSRKELRKFAENIILVQKGEIKTMIDWLDTWFK